MPKRLYSLFTVLLLVISFLQSNVILAKTFNMNFENKPFAYPVAKKVSQVDDYHGIKVADPYRWLEDADSEETKVWVEAENKLTFDYLSKIPVRQKIKDRLTKLWNFETYGMRLNGHEGYGIPFKKGSTYFYFKNNGIQNQSVLYITDSLNAEPKVLLDPNTFSSDGTVAISGISVSNDGNFVAYSLSTSGSDWIEWKIRDVKTGKDFPEVIKWVKFSQASWANDNKGFYYSRYDEPKKETHLKDINYFQKLYFHQIGTPQSEDKIVYERPDKKEWSFGGSVTDDDLYLVINIWEGTDSRNRVFYKELKNKDSKIIELISELEASYSFLGNDGSIFWFLTNSNASHGKIIAIDVKRPEKANWKEIIPEAKETLENVSVVGNRFIVSYLKDAHAQVKIHGLDGKFEKEIKLPGIGSVQGFTGERKDKETFYLFNSFTYPNTVYRYDLVSGKSTIYKQSKVDLDLNNYETKQVFYPSKDGTKIPMFLSYKKGLKLDGNNPTILYGYGGFNISLTPDFVVAGSVSHLLWMEMGGVFAVPNLRGGGEYGEEWHQAGIKLKKQNVFDDFIAAAEWLISNKYTSSPKLAIQGRSNGGLLVGACLTQRPDLFGAAIPGVGVLDMLRFHKFTIGWAWASDYGCADNPDEFKALYAYSPLHNIKVETSYPPTLIMTADHDDRVVPAHSFKFAATMQEAQGGKAPILIRIDTKSGHGSGKPKSKLIDEASDILSFLVHTFNMKVPY